MQDTHTQLYKIWQDINGEFTKLEKHSHAIKYCSSSLAQTILLTKNNYNMQR